MVKRTFFVFISLVLVFLAASCASAPAANSEPAAKAEPAAKPEPAAPKSMEFTVDGYKVRYPMQDLLNQDFEKSQLETWNKRFLVEVANPEKYELISSPAIVQITDLKIPREKLVPGSFFVATEDLKKVALTQIDDVNMDGVMDEIVFLVNLNAGAKAKFYIYYSEGGRNWQFHKRYTDASALPGWESELFGYRSYNSFILDTFAKPKDNPNLLLRQLYDEQLRQLYNHHTQSAIGMDTLNVGDTSGLAGAVVVLEDGSRIKPLAGAIKSEVLISGPVRSVVKMSKDPWVTDVGTFEITRTATIYAHHFETQINDTVKVSGATGAGEYGIGLRKEKVAQFEALESEGLLIQWQNQHPSIGEHGIGIYVDPAKITGIGDEPSDNYVTVTDKLSGDSVVSIDFVAFGVWKNSGFVSTADEFKEFSEFIVEQQAMPVVKILSSEDK